MRFGNLCTTAVALAAAAILTPALAAQKQAVQTNTSVRADFTASAMSHGPGIVVLQWNAVPYAVNYRIERAMQTTEDRGVGAPVRLPLQFFVIANAHPSNSYEDTGLWNDATYAYRVTAQFDTKAAVCQATSCTRVTTGIAWVTTAP